MLLRKVLLPIVVACVAACSQQVNTIKATKESSLTDNDGYLLLSVDSELDLEQLNISGQKSFHLGAADLTAGKHYILLALPAGDYQIESAKLSNWWSIRLKAGYWNFSVKSGQISYIGELQLKGQAPELENRASMALQYLEQNHANLLQKYQVRYSGPGTDAYFEYAAAQGGKR